jgi:hypothetical protein
MSRLAGRKLEEWLSNLTPKRLQRQPKTSVLSAQEKKDEPREIKNFTTRDVASTELFQALWLKEEILRMAMELEENQFTVELSKMKISS